MQLIGKKLVIRPSSSHHP